MTVQRFLAISANFYLLTVLISKLLIVVTANISGSAVIQKSWNAVSYEAKTI